MGENRKRLVEMLDGRPKSEQELIAEWLYKLVSRSMFDAEVCNREPDPFRWKLATAVVVQVVAGTVAEGDALLLDTRENGTKVVRVLEVSFPTSTPQKAMGVGDIIGLTLGGVLVKEVKESTRLRGFGVLPRLAKTTKKAKLSPQAKPPAKPKT